MAIKTLVAAIFASLLSGCYYDSVEELYPVSYGGACDTTGSSYSNDVAPAFASFNCSSCHSGTSPSAGIDLATAASIKSFVDAASPANSNRLMGAIRHLPGYTPMPNTGTKIEKCSADRIEGWILQGCPNN